MHSSAQLGKPDNILALRLLHQAISFMPDLSQMPSQRPSTLNGGESLDCMLGEMPHIWIAASRAG